MFRGKQDSRSFSATFALLAKKNADKSAERKLSILYGLSFLYSILCCLFSGAFGIIRKVFLFVPLPIFFIAGMVFAGYNLVEKTVHTIVSHSVAYFLAAPLTVQLLLAACVMLLLVRMQTSALWQHRKVLLYIAIFVGAVYYYRTLFGVMMVIAMISIVVLLVRHCVAVWAAIQQYYHYMIAVILLLIAMTVYLYCHRTVPKGTVSWNFRPYLFSLLIIPAGVIFSFRDTAFVRAICPTMADLRLHWGKTLIFLGFLIFLLTGLNVVVIAGSVVWLLCKTLHFVLRVVLSALHFVVRVVLGALHFVVRVVLRALHFVVRVVLSALHFVLRVVHEALGWAWRVVLGALHFVVRVVLRALHFVLRVVHEALHFVLRVIREAQHFVLRVIREAQHFVLRVVHEALGWAWRVIHWPILRSAFMICNMIGLGLVVLTYLVYIVGVELRLGDTYHVVCPFLLSALVIYVDRRWLSPNGINFRNHMLFLLGTVIMVSSLT
jgi:hypothetical protein